MRGQHARRDIINAIFYQARTGCQWCYLPSKSRKPSWSIHVQCSIVLAPASTAAPMPAMPCGCAATTARATPVWNT
ncbi:transposase [Streptomyces virginiae]|uniref:transposase n=1 Tax=Streptomyces virginiae TaxID=1961 RepID=UPI00365607DB